MSRRGWFGVLWIISLFLFVGCGEYNVNVGVKPRTFSVKKITPLTGTANIQVLPGAKVMLHYVYYNDKDAYILAYDSDLHSYIAYGITKEYEKYFDTANEFLHTLHLNRAITKRLEDGSYATIIPAIHIYVRMKLVRDRQFIGSKNLYVDFTDQILQTAQAKDVLYEYALKGDVSKFLSFYGLRDQLSLTRLHWSGSNKSALEGKGTLRFYFNAKHNSYADWVEFTGFFRNAIPQLKVHVRVQGSQCITDTIICGKKAVESASAWTSSSVSDLSATIERLVSEVVSKINRDRSEYRLQISRNRSRGKALNCSSAFGECTRFCNTKSVQGGMLSNSDRTSCRLWCESGKRQCDSGEFSKARHSMCSGMCEGLKKTNSGAFNVFGTSNYDECVFNCYQEL